MEHSRPDGVGGRPDACLGRALRHRMGAPHERYQGWGHMNGGPRQLALALDHTESFAREDFLGGPTNADALKLIDNWPDWPNRSVVLVGPEGSGKSHLAAIWANRAGARFVAGHSLAGT